jgi:hypothetical protein
MDNDHTTLAAVESKYHLPAWPRNQLIDVISNAFNPCRVQDRGKCLRHIIPSRHRIQKRISPEFYGGLSISIIQLSLVRFLNRRLPLSPSFFPRIMQQFNLPRHVLHAPGKVRKSHHSDDAGSGNAYDLPKVSETSSLPR